MVGNGRKLSVTLKKPYFYWGFLNSGAEERTRTSTPCRALHPECSASANSATSASETGSPGVRARGIRVDPATSSSCHPSECLSRN